MFSISNDSPLLSLKQTIIRNAEAILTNLVRYTPMEIKNAISEMRFPRVSSAQSIRFGSSLRMWLKDEIRNVQRSGQAVAVIPGIGKGMFSSGGSFNALVYGMLEEMSDEEEDSTSDIPHWAQCSVPNCPDRHHDPRIELFCSSIRDNNARFAIPLIFFEAFAVGYRLSPVSAATARVPLQGAVFEAKFGDGLEVIYYSLLRGVCMVRPDYDTEQRNIFVFPGRGTFGYSNLQ